MKKLTAMLLALIVLLALLPACSAPKSIERVETSAPQTQLSAPASTEGASMPLPSDLSVGRPTISFCALSYETAEELVASVDGAVVGKILGYRYQAFNCRTGKPTEPADCGADDTICTVYEMQVASVLKGSYSEKIEFYCYGGRGYDLDIEEQMAALGVTDPYKVPVVSGRRPDLIEVGKNYLILLRESNGTMPQITMWQNVFPCETRNLDIVFDELPLKEIILELDKDAWSRLSVMSFD